MSVKIIKKTELVSEAVITLDEKKFWDVVNSKYDGDYIKMMLSEYDAKVNPKYPMVKPTGKFDLDRDFMKQKKARINKFLKDFNGQFANASSLKNLPPDPDGFVYDFNGAGASEIPAGTVGAKPTIPAKKESTKKEEDKVVTSKKVDNAKAANNEDKKEDKKEDTKKTVKAKQEEDKKEAEDKGIKVSSAKVQILRRKNDAVKEKLYRLIGDYLVKNYFKGNDVVRDMDLMATVVLVVNGNEEVTALRVELVDVNSNKDLVDLENKKVVDTLVGIFINNIVDNLTINDKVKVVSSGINSTDDIYVILDIKNETIIKDIVNKFSLDENFGYKVANLVNEHAIYVQESVDTFICEKFFGDIKDLMETFESDEKGKGNAIRCYMVFKEGVEESQVRNDITLMYDGDRLLGYTELVEQEIVESVLDHKKLVDIGE